VLVNAVDWHCLNSVTKTSAISELSFSLPYLQTVEGFVGCSFLICLGPFWFV
jgi:hypothetical protein